MRGERWKLVVVGAVAALPIPVMALQYRPLWLGSVLGIALGLGAGFVFLRLEERRLLGWVRVELHRADGTVVQGRASVHRAGRRAVAIGELRTGSLEPRPGDQLVVALPDLAALMGGQARTDLAILRAIARQIMEGAVDHGGGAFGGVTVGEDGRMVVHGYYHDGTPIDTDSGPDGLERHADGSPVDIVDKRPEP